MTLQDLRGQGPPADIGTFQSPYSMLVYQHTFSGVTYTVAARAGERGWVLVDHGTNATAVSQSAVNALPDGGDLFYKRATYNIKQLQLRYDHTHIIAELGTVFQGSLDGTNILEIPLPSGNSLDHTIIENITFAGGAGSGIAISTTYGATAKYVRAITIIKCVFDQNLGGAIFLNNFEKIVIETCRFVDANGQPMITLQNNGFDSGNSRIYDNQFYTAHNSQTCVYVLALTGTIAGIDCRDNHYSFAGQQSMIVYRLNVNGGHIINVNIDSDRFENCDQLLHIDTNATQYCHDVSVHKIFYYTNEATDVASIINIHTGGNFVYNLEVDHGSYFANNNAGKHWIDSQWTVLTTRTHDNNVGDFAAGMIAGNAWIVDFYNNKGYNPVGAIATPYPVAAGDVGDYAAAQAFPSSNVNYRIVNSPKLITIYGGTVTNIQIGGTVTGLTSGAFYLMPSQVFKVVWTGQPSSVIYAL